jgi:hypothetical protein
VIGKQQLRCRHAGASRAADWHNADIVLEGTLIRRNLERPRAGEAPMPICRNADRIGGLALEIRPV